MLIINYTHKFNRTYNYKEREMVSLKHFHNTIITNSNCRIIIDCYWGIKN